MELSKISGLILGSRSSGIDQGLQNFRSAPMALHVMMRLAPQVVDLMINANRHIGAYEGFGVPVWPDEMQAVTGPLAGIHTGLLHCDTEFIVSVPCNAPLAPHDLVQRLADGLLAQGGDLAIAVTGAAATRQAHPIFCLMKSTLLEHLTHYLRSGGGSDIEAWHATLKVAEVHFDDESNFRLV